MDAARERKVAIIGAALDLGQGRRGVDMGPSAMRAAGLEERIRSLGYDVRDIGNVESPEAEATALEDERARYLPEIKQTCVRIAAAVAEASRAGEIPLVLGGDHSVALGTLAGLASVHGPGGLLWVDAHPDINTPDTSPSGNVHGMPLAAALGLAGAAFESDAWSLPAVDASRVALIGTRELDEGERQLLREKGVRVFTMSEIDRIGIERAVRESLDRVSGPGFVHVSFDMDVLDPFVAPGVGTPVRGGLTYREAHLALELMAESELAGSREVVEVNPILSR
ncbi:MAG: arginase [Gaiellaceae bacterium]